jgi:ribosomal protein S27AE
MIHELLRTMAKESKKPKEIKKCPDCGGDVVNEEGEKYCKKCGLVVE